MKYAEHAEKVLAGNRQEIKKIREEIKQLQQDIEEANKAEDKAAETGDYKAFEGMEARNRFAKKRIPILEKRIDELQKIPLITQPEFDSMLRETSAEMKDNAQAAIDTAAAAWKQIRVAWEQLRADNDALRRIQSEYWAMLRKGRDSYIGARPINESLFDRWIDNASNGHGSPGAMVDISKFLRLLNS